MTREEIVQILKESPLGEKEKADWLARLEKEGVSDQLIDGLLSVFQSAGQCAMGEYMQSMRDLVSKITKMESDAVKELDRAKADELSKKIKGS